MLPAAVRTSARVRLWNSFTPSCSSSVCTWRLTADWVRNNSVPALVNERWRAAASKPRSRSSEAGRLRWLCIRVTHAYRAQRSFVTAGWLSDIHACHINRRRHAMDSISSARKQPSRLLEIDQTHPLSVRVPVGSAVHCITGRVWLTQEGLPDDIVLAAGEKFVARQKGIIVMSGIGGAALV